MEVRRWHNSYEEDFVDLWIMGNLLQQYDSVGLVKRRYDLKEMGSYYKLFVFEKMEPKDL